MRLVILILLAALAGYAIATGRPLPARQETLHAEPLPRAAAATTAASALARATSPATAPGATAAGGGVATTAASDPATTAGADAAPTVPGAPAERRPPDSSAQITLSFAPVVRAAAPAVVNVNTTAAVDPFYAADPFLRRLYERQRPRGDGSALGSGVVVDPAGLVVTNAHVIRNAAAIRIGFNDRREYAATLLLKDERTDLAILRIEGEGPFPTVDLGNPAALEVGDLVLAIGNPFGVGQTVTQGIVSATARTEIGVSDSRFFIQTDAAINPGNSGGALIDMTGRLVGINTAIYSRTGGSIGIGFAIPADMVKIVLESARAGKPVRRPWLGAEITSVTSELAQRLGLDRAAGAVVTAVRSGGPAAKAGLEVADVVTAIDGIAVTDKVSFDYMFATRGLSGETEFSVSREGEGRAVTVALGPPPETPPRDVRKLAGRTPFAGATAENLSPAVADELNLPGDSAGVVLSEVEERSVAARVGLQARDIVRSINDKPVADTRALDAYGKRRMPYWDVVIERDGRRVSLTLGG